MILKISLIFYTNSPKKSVDADYKCDVNRIVGISQKHI